MTGDHKKLSADDARAWHPVIRELVKHENDLVNQRLSWLIQIQGLLFAALAFAWEKGPVELTILLSFLGIGTALSLWSALSLYGPAVRHLKRWWDNHKPDDIVDGPYVMGLWSPSSGMGHYLRPWRALPIIFIIAWAGVLATRLYHYKY